MTAGSPSLPVVSVSFDPPWPSSGPPQVSDGLERTAVPLRATRSRGASETGSDKGFYVIPWTLYGTLWHETDGVTEPK